MTEATSSTKELFQAAEVYWDEESKKEGSLPDYHLVIQEYQKVIDSAPSNFEERSYICDSKQRIAEIKAEPFEKRNMVPYEAIQYYKGAISCYEDLIREPGNAEGYDVNVVRYSLALALAKLAIIKKDVLNTQNSRNILVSTEISEYEADFNRAIKVLEEVPEKNEDLKFYNLGAAIYLMLGNLFAANAIVSKVVESKNEDPSLEKSYYYGLFNKGLILIEENRFHEARDFFYKCFSHDLEDYRYSSMIGDTYMYVQDYKSAIELYQAAGDLYSLNGAALCYLFLANYKDSIASASTSLKALDVGEIVRRPQLPWLKIDAYTVAAKQLMVESLLILGTSFLRQDDNDSAMPIIRNAKEIVEHYDLNFRGPLLLEGMVLLEANKSKAAKKDFEIVISKYPTYAEAHDLLGLCHFNMGNTEKAIDSIKKSIDLKPELVTAHLNLYKIESYRNKPPEFGDYWTKSGKRKAALAMIILVGFATAFHAFQYPDTNYVNSTTANFTVQQGNLKKDISNNTTLTEDANLEQLRLAIIIGLIVIILWPSIRTFKLGTSSLEIEKITEIETKKQIYLSWIPLDLVFRKSRALV